MDTTQLIIVGSGVVLAALVRLLAAPVTARWPWLGGIFQFILTSMPDVGGAALRKCACDVAPVVFSAEVIEMEAQRCYADVARSLPPGSMAAWNEAPDDIKGAYRSMALKALTRNVS